MLIIMDANDYIKFANENPISCIATLDNDQPRVRAMMMWYADKTGLYYSTAANKDFYKQLKANPKVEVCFSKGMDMIRVSGQVEFINALEIKKKLLDARPFLKQAGLTPENPGLIVFRIAKCKAQSWSRETNAAAKTYVTFG